ncbi:hypothetical protein CTI12_AA145060 [Artemisia annua]|uniref:Zinc finger, CCHC-type n=1 Tax=Artemisia annua TaxID=35608 RepID=A0A2U1PJI7_ARTAN|nr:hypothetical protein CTI12_AA145060 [Artemisia annua]
MCVCSAAVAGKAVTTATTITGSIHQMVWFFLANARLRSGLPRDCWIKQKEYILGMEIIRNQSGNTLRGSQSRVHNGKLVQTLLEGHSMLSLEGSLSGDCDEKKNGKWSYIYAVGSREYQMVCTRPDIASVDVGMLDRFDRGLQTNVQVIVDFDYAMGRSITRYGFMIQGCAESSEAMMLHMEALSTTEAAYMTLMEAAKEAI